LGNRLLSCLDASDLALLAPHFRQVPLIHGDVLHEPAAAVDWVYFPLSGAVSLVTVMKGGEAIETGSVGREGAIGLSAHSGLWQTRSRALVQAPGTAKAISSSMLRAALAQSEQIRDLAIRYREALSAQAEQIAACNALHSVEERIARWLLQASDRLDGAELPVTQDALSQMLGVRRTTVTIVAQKLQQNDLIRYRRGHIIIVNPGELHALACECYDACKQADALFDQSALEVRKSA
jgi:CRP-like cAMP-binding protein